MADKRWVPGTNLTEEDRRHVLAAYVHRYTKQHVPKWAVGTHYQPHFNSDLEWLANSLFCVRINGRLGRRVKHCISKPTNPLGVTHG